MRETILSHRIFVKEPEGKRPLGIIKRRRKDNNIKKNIK
jgi:hypothetical protein